VELIFCPVALKKAKMSLICQELSLESIVQWLFIAQVSRKAMERIWRPTIRDDHGSATQKSESAYGVFLNPSKLEGTSILVNHIDYYEALNERV